MSHRFTDTPDRNQRALSDLFGVLLSRLLIAIVVACVTAATIKLVTGRERLIREASERAKERLFFFDESETHWLAEYDSAGERLRLRAPQAPAGFDEQARLAAVAARLAPTTLPERRWKPRGSTGDLYVIRAARVLTNGDPRIRVSSERVTGMPALLRRVLIEAALVGGLLGAVSIWFVGQARLRHARALRRLTAVVSRIGKSERLRDLPPAETRELDRLHRSLETTLRSLTDRLTALGTQRAEAKAILRSMPGAVIALDLEQRIVNTNRVAERMLDLDPDAVRGRLLHEAVRQPALLRFAAESSGAPDLRGDEFTLRGLQERTVSASSRPLLSADGELSGVVIVLQDVTRLRKLENLRRDFAANASHELRTPVTNILGYIETLEEVQDASAEDRARFVGIIRRNAERLAAIIEDMLELARLESPEASAGPGVERTTVLGMLEEVSASFAPDADRKDIRIDLECDPGLRADLNHGLMGQALGNLVANAIRYSPSGTVIRVTARRINTGNDAGAVELSVEDQGPGIPEEHLSRLFERFYRVDPARSRELGGTGLGLAIAKHVAMLHGGEIAVTSEMGRGSRFWIRVPERAAGRDPGRSRS